MKTIDPLAAYSDDVLRQTLKAREEDRVAAAKKSHEEYGARLAKGLTADMVNLLQPDHGRTSCSDANLSNGWGSADNEGARCIRCALLDTLRSGYIPYPFRFHVEVG